ncbi:NUDIX hydrolase [Candidatus Babeliales bacterium]|nr:NUDIX hydrolase [Candidatus Babeliales bacterium]MBP9844381.1 NUDIX hydrolase [Candidatus Babeliales bacterium]
MRRNNLRALLRTYQPTVEEKDFKDRMKAFLDIYEDCFHRSQVVGHFTASALLLNKDGSKALLLHHAKLDIWVQPGGHADGEHNLLKVAIKEAQEESGIMGISPLRTEIFDIDIHKIPANSKEAAHDHYDVRFLLQVTSDEDFVQNRESKALRWVDHSSIQELTEQRSVVRLFEKWKKLSSSI